MNDKTLGSLEPLPQVTYQEVIKSPFGNYVRAKNTVLWAGFLTMLVICLALSGSLLYVTMDPPVLAGENGKIIGHIQYDDVDVRSPVQIKRQLKEFVRYYKSFNSTTIGEDRLLAAQHMCPPLAKRAGAKWRSDKQNLNKILASRQVSSVIFEPNSVNITHLRGNEFEAIISAELQIPRGIRKEVNPIKLQVRGTLIQMSNRFPLGLGVCKLVDLLSGEAL